MTTTDVLAVGSLARFDGHKDFVARVMSIRIGEGNVVSYELEWDTDEKGTYATHVFSADRVTAYDQSDAGKIQIGFGGSHPLCCEPTVICRSNK